MPPVNPGAARRGAEGLESGRGWVFAQPGVEKAMENLDSSWHSHDWRPGDEGSAGKSAARRELG